MTLHISVLGIDGSGKSMVAALLPCLLAAEFNVRAASAGETFQIIDPGQGPLASRSTRDRMPITGNLSKFFKHQAKRTVNHRRFYPFFKLPQMIFQDDAARRLGDRYAPVVIVSDGNVLLSAMGRAANYLHPASEKEDIGLSAPEPHDMKAGFEYLLDGTPLPDRSRAKLPPLRKAKRLRQITQLLGLYTIWLPDIVIFLDISPETAIERIASRSHNLDRHENEADLAQAREMYAIALQAFRLYRSPESVHCINVDSMTPIETLHAIVDTMKPHVLAPQPGQPGARPAAVATLPVKLSSRAVWKSEASNRTSVREFRGQ